MVSISGFEIFRGSNVRGYGRRGRVGGIGGVMRGHVCGVKAAGCGCRVVPGMTSGAGYSGRRGVMAGWVVLWVVYGVRDGDLG